MYRNIFEEPGNPRFAPCRSAGDPPAFLPLPARRANHLFGDNVDNPGQLPQGHRADNSARFTFPGNNWGTKGTKGKTANKTVRSFRQFPAEKGQTRARPHQHRINSSRVFRRLEYFCGTLEATRRLTPSPGQQSENIYGNRCFYMGSVPGLWPYVSILTLIPLLTAFSVISLKSVAFISRPHSIILKALWHDLRKILPFEVGTLLRFLRYSIFLHSHSFSQ